VTDIDNITASQRILAHLHEGRLVQNEWHSVAEKGRDFACILGAISPHIDDSRKCPASVMPKWLARLVVPLFDYQTEDAAMTWAARFGTQMAQWHRLDSAAWDRVRDAFCAACVADAWQSAEAYAYAAAADAAAAAARAAALAAAADAADADAARQACWTRMATALCDLIDAELAARAAKETP
jgi:hypothetical protein